MSQTPSPIVTPPDLPGATAGLILGILSIGLGMVPLVNLTLAFIGLQKAREARQIAQMNPGVYANEGVAQVGFVCSIVGLAVSALSLLFTCSCLALLVLGAVAGVAGAAAR